MGWYQQWLHLVAWALSGIGIRGRRESPISGSATSTPGKTRIVDSDQYFERFEEAGKRFERAGKSRQILK